MACDCGISWSYSLFVKTLIKVVFSFSNFGAEQISINFLTYKFFDLILYVSVNSHGHVEMVCWPYHTFTWASLTKHLTST